MKKIDQLKTKRGRFKRLLAVMEKETELSPCVGLTTPCDEICCALGLLNKRFFNCDDGQDIYEKARELFEQLRL